MDEALLNRVRSHLSSVKVPSNYDKVYKDECMYSFADPESEHGLFVNMSNWHGVGARFLEVDHAKTGNVLYYNEQHRRIPLTQQEQTSRDAAPTKMAIGGDHGFQVGQKGYNITKEQFLVLMPEKTMIPLPCPELPELILNAITAIQVSLTSIAVCHAMSQAVSQGMHALPYRATKEPTGSNRQPPGRISAWRASTLER